MLVQPTIQAPQFSAAAELPQPIVMGCSGIDWTTGATAAAAGSTPAAPQQPFIMGTNGRDPSIPLMPEGCKPPSGFPQLPLVHSASMTESVAARQLPAEPLSYPQSGCRVGSQKKREMPTSISFEGCGAAISYHLAVYEGACQIYGRENIKSNKVRMVGTSSGSIAALIAALGLDAEFWRDRLLQIWDPMGKQCFGLLQVDYYVGLALDEILSSVGDKAYEHLCGRLYVSMTHFPMNNVMMSEWKSNGHVKKCILASCFIPVAMLRPVQDGKCFAIDGGFSSNKPRLDGSTCLVSPSRAPGAGGYSHKSAKNVYMTAARKAASSY
jgi:hypothetical protein